MCGEERDKEECDALCDSEQVCLLLYVLLLFLIYLLSLLIKEQVDGNTH